MGRQSIMMLDNLGIIVDTQKAYDDYAKSIGKASSELTDQEKKIAFNSAALESDIFNFVDKNFLLKYPVVTCSVATLLASSISTFAFSI